jgi:hypothetical protein
MASTNAPASIAPSPGLSAGPSQMPPPLTAEAPVHNSTCCTCCPLQKDLGYLFNPNLTGTDARDAKAAQRILENTQRSFTNRFNTNGTRDAQTQRDLDGTLRSVLPANPEHGLGRALTRVLTGQSTCKTITDAPGALLLDPDGYPMCPRQLDQKVNQEGGDRQR